jgi:TPR repeat protein
MINSFSLKNLDLRHRNKLAFVILLLGSSAFFVALAYRALSPRIDEYYKLRGLTELANDGDPGYQRLLGEYFYEKADYNSALKWELTAAERGDRSAQNFIGLYYRYGINEHMKPAMLDSAKAREWFEKSATQDFQPSLVELCEIYQQGLGVSPDQKTAYFWCSLAEPSGRSLEFKQLSRDSLDLESQQRVERRVAEWIASHRKNP